MALQVWLPLNGNIKNQGLSDLSFSVVSSNTSGSTSGKIGSCYYNSSHTEGGLTSNKTINLGSQQSMFCWVKFDRFYESASLTGVIGQHRYQKNTGMGITTYRLSETTAYLSVNTGTGSNRTFNDYRGSTVINANQWYHVGYTFDGSTIRLYVNGNLDGTFTGHSSQLNVEDYVGIFMWSLNDSTITNTLHANYKLKGYLNDVRIYDHCLSPKEIKEISKGLVLHYPMNNNDIQVLESDFLYPYFENADSTGGWSHWGRTGAIGSHGQSTDSTYKFGNFSQYAHWVANDLSATAAYLCYQERLFGGGHRCLHAVIKEQNGIPITYDVCFPSWNGNDGGVSRWDSISHLGNGFYYCKCESIIQVAGGTNSNANLVGIYVNPGYKIYMSFLWIENKEKCSDPFFQSTSIYDCSGFGYNGTVTSTTAPILGSDSLRYNSCFNFDTTGKYITCPAIDFSGMSSSYSFAWWGKTPSWDVGLMYWGFSNGNRLNYYSGYYWNTGDGSQNPFYSSGTTTITRPSINEWHHYVVTGDGSKTKLYVDGNLYGTAKTNRNISGTQIYIHGWDSSASYKNAGDRMSDFRIYATPLSAEDVKELYNTSAMVCDNGTVMAYSLEE